MKIIAHRGASAEYPENTITAFERALALGADAIETDLQRTRDGRIVLRHDDLVARDGRWFYVRELTFEELRRVDAGNGERIPALEEFLELVGGRCPVFLDVKAFGVAPALAEFLAKNRCPAEVHVTSALQSEIREMADLCPKIPRSVVLAALPFSFETVLREAGVREVSLYRGSIQEAVIGRLRDLGILARAYPVNSLRETQTFAAWGMEAVFTDDPAAMRPLLRPGK